MKNMIVCRMGQEGICRFNLEKCWSTGPKINRVSWCTVSGMAYLSSVMSDAIPRCAAAEFEPPCGYQL